MESSYKEPHYVCAYVCVGCVCVSVLVAQSCTTLQLHGLLPTRLFCPWDSPGKDTGVSSHSLLQKIFWHRDQTHPTLQSDTLLSEPPGKRKEPHSYAVTIGFPGSSIGKESARSVGNPGSIPS